MEFDPLYFLFHFLAMPSSDSDIRILSSDLEFVPVETRVPLKFGTEVLTSVTCARVRLAIVGMDGRESIGWGETPLSVQWVWPSEVPYTERFDALLDFCRTCSREWTDEGSFGHDYGNTLKRSNKKILVTWRIPKPWNWGQKQKIGSRFKTEARKTCKL